MRMNFAMAGINDEPFKIRFDNESFKYFLPNSPITPSAEATMCIFPVAKIRGEIPPRSPSSQYPEDGVDKQSVIGGRATDAALGTGKKFFNVCPYPVGNIISSMCRHMLSPYWKRRDCNILFNLTTLPRVLEKYILTGCTPDNES